MTQPIVSAWLFPGPPACSAMAEIADGRHIDTLKPQYHRLTDLGSLIELDASDVGVGCNGFSTQNAALIKQYSTQQFITVSATIAGMVALSTSPPLLASCLNQLVTLLKTAQFTGGVEIDCEGFSQWTASDYNAYKNVVGKLGQGLHNAGYQLMLDGPGITGLSYQNYYPFRYEELATLPVDYLVPMVYDFQFDRGCGTSISTLQDVTDCCNWMKSKVTDPTKIVIGLPTYGYVGHTGTYTCTEQTYQQMTQRSGFNTAIRAVSSGEMMWSLSGMSYSYSDVTTINTKIQTVLNTGINAISLWHIGGANPYPTILQPPQPVPTPIPSPNPALAAFNTAYPGFSKWYTTNFDANGNYIGK